MFIIVIATAIGYLVNESNGMAVGAIIGSVIAWTLSALMSSGKGDWDN